MTKTTTDRINLNLVDQPLKDYQKPEDCCVHRPIMQQG